MHLAEFDYELPDALIARHPAKRRRDSRLLVVNTGSGGFEDVRFADLPDFLRRGDLLVFNDTRVIPARLFGRKRTSGGRVEVLVERVLSERTALAQLRASKSPGVGSEIELAAGRVATVRARRGGFYELEFSAAVDTLLGQFGEIPLPPYLGRGAERADDERYQTVYARRPGAVAAPTAGLHFDEAMLADTQAAGISHAYVTLHVGAGTFQPLRAEVVAANRLHAERVHVAAAVCRQIEATRAAGGRVVAVGTTSVRALEAASVNGHPQPLEGETDLFIVPGYRFTVVDALLTNFHLPRSSLLVLVAAFAGRELVLRAYEHAVAKGYRFFSYGDAMLLLSADARSRTE